MIRHLAIASLLLTILLSAVPPANATNGCGNVGVGRASPPGNDDEPFGATGDPAGDGDITIWVRPTPGSSPIGIRLTADLVCDVQAAMECILDQVEDAVPERGVPDPGARVLPHLVLEEPMYSHYRSLQDAEDGLYGPDGIDGLDAGMIGSCLQRL